MGGRTRIIPTGDGWMTVVSNRRRRPPYYYRAAATGPSLPRRQRRYHHNTRKSRRYLAPLHQSLYSTYLQRPRSISQLFPLRPGATQNKMGQPPIYHSHHLLHSLLPPSPTPKSSTFLSNSHQKHSIRLNNQKLKMQNLIKYGIKALEPIQGFPQNTNTSAVGLKNGARHIPHPLPPQNQPWNYFLDQNPWSGVALNQGNTTASSHQPLPLPPDPTSSAWKGRCYNCLQFGHDQNTCPCPDRVCAICWKKGHEARACDQSMLAKRQRFDPLEPRGNLGESLLPDNSVGVL